MCDGPTRGAAVASAMRRAAGLILAFVATPARYKVRDAFDRSYCGFGLEMWPVTDGLMIGLQGQKPFIGPSAGASATAGAPNQESAPASCDDSLRSRRDLAQRNL